MKKVLPTSFLLLFVFLSFITPNLSADASPEFYGLLLDIKASYVDFFKGFDPNTTRIRTHDKCRAGALQTALQTISAQWAEEAFTKVVINPLLEGLKTAVGGTGLEKVFTVKELYDKFNESQGDPEAFAKKVAWDYIKGKFKGAPKEVMENEKAKKLYDQTLKTATAVYDKIGKALAGVNMKNEFLNAAPSSAPCSSKIRAIWNKRLGKITIIVSGDCKGNKVTTSQGSCLLKQFSVKISGRVTFKKDSSGNYIWKGIFNYATVEATCGKRKFPPRNFGPRLPRRISTPKPLVKKPATRRTPFPYRNNFQGKVGSEWSKRSTDTTPKGGRRFLGQFGNGTVSLTLNGLPAHRTLTVSFDLYLINSWDGNYTGYGPDIWKLRVGGGKTLLSTTFSNLEENGYKQSYPQPYPKGANKGGTGSKEFNSLGYSYFGDSVYRLSFTFPHSGKSVRLEFSASGLQNLEDESWGIDNIVVKK